MQLSLAQESNIYVQISLRAMDFCQFQECKKLVLGFSGPAANTKLQCLLSYSCRANCSRSLNTRHACFRPQRIRANYSPNSIYPIAFPSTLPWAGQLQQLSGTDQALHDSRPAVIARLRQPCRCCSAKCLLLPQGRQCFLPRPRLLGSGPASDTSIDLSKMYLWYSSIFDFFAG